MSTEISAPVMNITELCMKTITNAMKQPIEAIVRTLSEIYGFDFDEAMERLGNPVVNVKPMAKRGSKKAAAATSSSDASSSDESTKAAKKGKEKNIPLPFMAALVRPDLCQGIAFNYGNFTQCKKAAEAGGEYCAKCQKEADASSSGIPKCGNVARRLAMGDKYEDLSDKPRKPGNFAKILATKYPNVSVDEVRAEAAKRGVELDDAIFVMPETKPRGGRPKKAEAAAATTEDEPAPAAEMELTAEESGAESGADETKAEANMPHVVIAISEPPTKRKYVRKTAEEKAQLEAEKEARRAEKERKAAEKQAEKERKEAEKAAKKQQEEETAPALAPAAETQEEKVVEVAPAPAPVQPVKKTKTINVDGEKCVVDLTTNIVYRKSDVVAIGTYDPETKEFTPYDEEEAEDDENEDEDV